MKRFAGSLVCVISMAILASCGERDGLGSSSLTGKSNKNRRRDYVSPSSETTQPLDPDNRDNGRFPIKPNLDMTPGSLCQHASSTRYPEHIKYCDRNVEGDIKGQVFSNYDHEFGYRTSQMERSQFKIDHLIPLCMGGSNNIDNLWPQHATIFEHTDPVEPYLCSLMADSKIKQAEAVQMIITIKQSPFTAEEELRKLESRF